MTKMENNTSVPVSQCPLIYSLFFLICGCVLIGAFALIRSNTVTGVLSGLVVERLFVSIVKKQMD